MKWYKLTAIITACIFSFPSHAYLYYVIVDPAKSGQKSQQMANDQKQFLEDEIKYAKEIATDIADYLKDFDLQGDLDSFKTALISASKSEPYVLQNQASMEPAVGLCDLVSFSINDFAGDHGCAFYHEEDNFDGSIVLSEDMKPIYELDVERFKRSIDKFRHRNSSVDAETLHSEMSMIYFDVLGQAKMTEVSQEDREAMDQFVDTVMGSTQTVVDPVDSTSSPQAKLLFTRQLSDHLRNNYLNASAKATYVRRSRVGDGMSMQSDLWQVRDNELQSLIDMNKPVMTGGGLSPRPSLESIIRGDAIMTARLGRALQTHLDNSLQEELTLSVRTLILLELLNDGK